MSRVLVFCSFLAAFQQTQAAVPKKHMAPVYSCVGQQFLLGVLSDRMGHTSPRTPHPLCTNSSAAPGGGGALMGGRARHQTLLHGIIYLYIQSRYVAMVSGLASRIRTTGAETKAGSISWGLAEWKIEDIQEPSPHPHRPQHSWH